APVAAGVEVAKTQLGRQPCPDLRDAVRDLPRDEQLAAARGFVIEEDPRAREDPITLPIVYRDVVAVDLRDAIRAPRVEGRQLVLRARADLAEHFRGGRLVEAALVGHAPDGLDQPRHAEPSR